MYTYTLNNVYKLCVGILPTYVSLKRVSFEMHLLTAAPVCIYSVLHVLL